MLDLTKYKLNNRYSFRFQIYFLNRALILVCVAIITMLNMWFVPGVTATAISAFFIVLAIIAVDLIFEYYTQLRRSKTKQG